MGYPYYAKGLENGRPSSRAESIETLSLWKISDPSGYRPSANLSRAVNAALILGKPLLLTGEPGTGKTELARSVAHELGGEGEPVPVWKFETKSTSSARDLFYTYDAIAAFQSPPGQPRPAGDFITYQALGRAILEAFPSDHPGVKRMWPKATSVDQPEHDRHGGPRRSIVLIDEIDKAPRDFPNDLLNEIERLYFRVPEFENRASPNENGRELPATLRPIIIVTSNSEKSLPDPFLRRCVYFHIDFPREEEMRMILAARLPEIAAATELVNDAISLFYQLRGDAGGPHLRKAPSTAELIDWVRLVAWLPGGLERSERTTVFAETISALVKTTDDRTTAEAYVRETWRPVRG